MFDSATDDARDLLVIAEGLCGLRNPQEFQSRAEPRDAGAPPLPPPPPPPAIPAAPGAAAIVIPAATDPASFTAADALIDSAGVKWDAKFHTSTKTKDIDGRWKTRKSREAPVPLARAAVPSVTKSAPPPPPPQMPAGAPPVGTTYQQAPPPPPPPPPTVMPQQSDDTDIDVESDSASPGEPERVSAGTAPVAIDFAGFISRLTAGMNDGSITQIRVAEVQKQLGLVSLFSLGDTEVAKLQDAISAFGFLT
jgi:hypothetical protein